jgi:hypothetical protein
MKTSNPYGANDKVLVPPETIAMQEKNASGKAKARYPHKPLGVGLKGDGGPIRTRALTPGTSPTGS